MTDCAELTVRLIAGKDLVAKDSNGKSDPYAEIKLVKGKASAKSKTIEKELNPQWNQSFTLEVEDLGDSLIVNVFDHDSFGKDDPLGITNPISLKGLEHLKESVIWAKLNLDNTPNAGQVNLGLKLKYSAKQLDIQAKEKAAKDAAEKLELEKKQKDEAEKKRVEEEKKKS